MNLGSKPNYDLLAAEIFPDVSKIVEVARSRHLDPKFSFKSDDSPVSEVDLAVHEKLRLWFSKHYPNHTFISEEQTNPEGGNPNGSYVFVDPIDGTENFVSGIPFWGSGISIYTEGKHAYSEIVAPDLGLRVTSIMDFPDPPQFKSRIVGYSSSSRGSDLVNEAGEFRILGSAMVNFLFTIEGRFAGFKNSVGAECWDILPGLNIARKAGLEVEVNGEPYLGQPLFPGQKYKLSLARNT
jgi:myo-inositol-1(or 4)-monophosphatase